MLDCYFFYLDDVGVIQSRPCSNTIARQYWKIVTESLVVIVTKCPCLLLTLLVQVILWFLKINSDYRYLPHEHLPTGTLHLTHVCMFTRKFSCHSLRMVTGLVTQGERLGF